MAALTLQGAPAQAIQQARAVNKLDPAAKVRNTGITNFGAVQFSELSRYITGDADGSATLKPVNMAQYQRNTADGPNLPPRGSPPIHLGWNRAFAIGAGIGQPVTVTLLFGAAGTRQAGRFLPLLLTSPANSPPGSPPP